MPADEQELRFLELDGARVAYATLGVGPALLVPALWAGHLERDWSLAEYREFFCELARDHTVVRYDRLGTGLSDRDVDPAALGVELELRTLEARRCSTRWSRSSADGSARSSVGTRWSPTVP